MTAKAAIRKKPVREAAREEARGAFRAAILSAAERVFSRAGFYTARMADVAREAGVGVGTLYNYFESKEVIFDAILDDHQEGFWARINQGSSGDDPIARLKSIVVGAFDYLDEHGDVFAILMERGGVGECDMERLTGARVAKRYEEFLDLVEKAIRAAVRAKKIRADVDTRLLVAMLSGAMNGATYAWMKRGRRGRLSSVSDELFSLFLQGASHS